jgi:hypothetical protein
MKYKVKFIQQGTYGHDYDTYESQLYHWAMHGEGIVIRTNSDNRTVAFYSGYQLISVTEIDDFGVKW